MPHPQHQCGEFSLGEKRNGSCRGHQEKYCKTASSGVSSTPPSPLGCKQTLEASCSAKSLSLGNLIASQRIQRRTSRTMADHRVPPFEQTNDVPSTERTPGIAHEQYRSNYGRQGYAHAPYDLMASDYVPETAQGYPRTLHNYRTPRNVQLYSTPMDEVCGERTSADSGYVMRQYQRIQSPEHGHYSGRFETAPGYPFNALICPPQHITTTVMPPLSSAMAAPWVYPLPRTVSSSMYGYTTNMPCVASHSLFPPAMIYTPSPMQSFVTPSVQHPIVLPDEADVRAQHHHRTEVKLHNTPLVSHHNENDTTKEVRKQESFRTKTNKRGEKCFSPGGKSSHVRTSTSITAASQTPSRASPINDRVLAKFKTNKAETFSLENAFGHLVSFCLDQTGSRFIQERLVLATDEEIGAVFDELSSHALTLMRDVFGNYIIQILLQNGSSAHRHALAQILKENTLSLSLHVYGCRVVQRALEVLSEDDALEIVRNLDTHVSRCIKDMNGNHVIQKAICVLDLDKIPYIVKVVEDRVLPFSVHPYGCRVVQRILERVGDGGESITTRETIMTTVVENISELSLDLYGNYVVQHVLHYSEKSIRRTAIDALMSAPIDFACHKYASNVLEEALVSADDEEKRIIVKAFITPPRRGEGGDSLNTLATNRFGNYVVQRLLDVVDDDLAHLVMSCYAPRVRTLKKFKYGKHIAARVERMASCPADSDNDDANEHDTNNHRTY